MMRDSIRNTVLCASPLIALLLGHASDAKAGVTTYFGLDDSGATTGGADSHYTPSNSLSAEQSFLSAFSGGTTGVENFESYGSASRPSTLTFTGSSVTASLHAEGSYEIIGNNFGDFGAFSTDGTNATDGMKYFQADGLRDDVLAFSAPVSGVGFFVTDMADGSGDTDSVSITLHFNDGTADETVSTGNYSGLPSGNVLFFGATNNLTDISGATIAMLGGPNGNTDSTGLDDLTVGMYGSVSAVPEPSSLALTLGMGLFGLVYRAKERRNRK